MPDTPVARTRFMPSAVLAVVAIVAYLAVLTALEFVFPVKYTQLADSTHNLLVGVVIPVGTGALMLAYLLTLSTTNFNKLTLGFLLLAALGMLLVGFLRGAADARARAGGVARQPLQPDQKMFSFVT